MSGTVQGIATAIREIVRAEGQVPGSHLAHAVKRRFPDWYPTDSGARNLREFIGSHVPDVSEVGRSGMDVVYGTATTPSQGQPCAPTQATAVDFWRVWVSPNSPLSLAVDRLAGSVQAVPRRASVAPTQCLIEPPSAAEHRGMARQFLDRVPEPLREQLSPVVELTSPTWWQTWLARLRGTQQLAEWMEFRHDRLERSLGSRLKELGIDDDVAARAIGSVLASRAASPARNERRPAYDVLREDYSGQSLRRLVALAVSQMSSAELRELRLPLGVVLDVLASKSR